MASSEVPASERAPAAQSALLREGLDSIGAPGSYCGLQLDDAIQLAWAVVLARVTSDPCVRFGSRVEGNVTGAPSCVVDAPALVHAATVCDELTAGELAAALRDGATSFTGQPRGTYSTWLDIRVAPGEAPITADTSFCLAGTRTVGGDVTRTVHLHRAADFFDAPTCELLLDALLHVLAQLQDGHERVADLNVVSEKERRRMLVVWNDTARPFPSAVRIESLFEAQVQERPHAPALADAGGTLTFAELDARANRLAVNLMARGIGPGARVGVYLERGNALVVAMLGVCKSGAAYVPMDPGYPSSRLAFMWEDANCALLVTDTRGKDAARAFVDDDKQVCVDESVGCPVARAPRHAGGADDLAYVIYTSGSTGNPNGVAVSHRAVVNTLDWVNRELQVGPADTLLFVTSPCFDLSVYDVFGALGAGASLVVASSADLADPGALRRLLVERGVTLWDSAPATLQHVLSCADEDLDGIRLRLIMLSGDWVPLPLARRLRARFPETRLEVLGGATEAAIWSNHFCVDAVDPAWNSIPYGRPIQNARYYVLDEKRRPLPWGVPGHLYIGGVCLADGYVNRPEITAQRFVPDPFVGGSARLYKTGDLCRFMPDGNLEFLGRSDFQVKVRGFRIEIGELENALASLEGVSEAVASPYSNRSGDVELCAFLVLRSGVARSEADIRSELRRVLPVHMLPARLVLLSALPVSPNGKIDRKALPALMAGASDASRAPAPKGELESQLFAIWARLLERTDFGREDNFFDLGGQSLLAAALVREVELELGLVVNLATFLEAPTLASMARSTHAIVPLSPVSPDLWRRTAKSGRAPLIVVGGGPFLLLHLHLAAMLPEDQTVYFLRDAEDSLVTWPQPMRAFAVARALRRAGVRDEAALIGLHRAVPFADQLARALERTGVRLGGFVDLDGPLGSGQGPKRGSRLVVRSTGSGPSRECAAPGLITEPAARITYPGSHLAFLSDGRASSVFGAIIDWVDAQTL
ncbi:MAG: hypothetical protein RL385_1993 [Pseudomonadota bacterium]